MKNATTTTFENPSDAMEFLGLENTRKEFNRFTNIVYFGEEVIKEGGKQCHYCFDTDRFIIQEVKLG